MRLRRVLFTAHLCIALAAGIFIAILGVTGSIMAFEPEIEHLQHWHLWHVNVPAGGRPLSLAQLDSVAHVARPGAHVEGFQLPTETGFSSQVLIGDSALYVDPYTGRVLGANDGPPRWLIAVHQLHTHLMMPRRLQSAGSALEVAGGIALLVMTLTGLYLWWPIKRWRIRWEGNVRKTWFDLHNTFGITSLVFILVLTATGIVIGMEGVTTPLLYRLTGSHPQPRPRLAIRPPRAPGVPIISPDSALVIARTAAPGAVPFLINVPAPDEPYYVRVRYPEDRTPGGRSAVVIDPAAARVTWQLDSRTGPAGERLRTLNRALHTGDRFGLPSKIIMSLASLLAVVQLASGLVMWWKRGRRLQAANSESTTGDIAKS